MPASSVTVSITEAKNRLCELVRKAADEAEITITSHGKARARLSKAQGESRPFSVDWQWLRRMEVSRTQTPSENLVRPDRDGRD